MTGERKPPASTISRADVKRLEVAARQLRLEATRFLERQAALMDRLSQRMQVVVAEIDVLRALLDERERISDDEDDDGAE